MSGLGGDQGLKDNEIKRWRKRHREGKRTMTVETACLVLGIGNSCYNKQITGERPVSYRSRLAMFIWDMLDEHQRARLLVYARGLRSEQKDDAKHK